MEAADILCESLFHWLENRKKCAGELKKLAQELEDHQHSNTTQGVGATSVLSISAGAAFRGRARDPPVENEGVSSSTFDKATKLIKEDETAGTSIQNLLRDLKVRCAETLKVRCAEAPLGTHADELDCEVTTLLMSALARSYMTPYGPARAEASDFISRALGLDRFPEITSGLKVSGKEMVKNIELIGIKTVAEAGSRGVIGLGIFQCDLIVKTEELVQGNRVTEASEFLRDSARKILEDQRKLKGELDAMHETIQKLLMMSN